MHDTAQTERVAKIDRWLLWPVLSTLGIIEAVALLCGLPGSVSFFLVPLSLVLFAVGAVVLTVTALTFLFRKQFRTGASVQLALIAPVFLWWPINWTAQCAHLALSVGLGVGCGGGRCPTMTGDKFVASDWSVGFAGGPNTFLIYDPTGEIALPTAQHKQPSNTENGFDDCAGHVQTLLPHYYICRF